MSDEEIYFTCPYCSATYNSTQFNELEHISFDMIPDGSGVMGHARCRTCNKDFHYNTKTGGFPVVVVYVPDFPPDHLFFDAFDLPDTVEPSDQQASPVKGLEPGPQHEQAKATGANQDAMTLFDRSLDSIDGRLSPPERNRKISEALDRIILEPPSQIEAGLALLKNKLHLGAREIEAFRKELNQRRDQIKIDKAVQKINAVLSNISKPPKRFSDDEREKAIAYLKDPDLFNNISRDIAAAGEIVGEDVNKMMLYLAATSRKFKKPISLVIFGKSSTGKSYLANAIQQFMPEEDTLVLSSVSAKALEYAGEQLKHKCILVQEWEGLTEILPTLRTLQSEGKLARYVTIIDPVTKTRKAVVHDQDCPCSVIVTTTKEGIHNENSTRIFELYVDESLEQTKNIVGHTLRRADMTKRMPQKDKRQILDLHHNVQRVLDPVEVNIPYAGLLSFPATTARHRRDSDRFVNLIKAVAFLRQKQKEPESIHGVECINADTDDYRLAYSIGLGVIRETLSPISDRAKHAMMVCCELNDRLVEAKKDPWFSVTDIQDTASDLDLDFGNRQDLYKQLDNLEEYEYIERKQGRKNATKYYKVCFPYERNEAGEIVNIDAPDFKEIPTPDQLQERLRSHGIMPPDSPPSETEDGATIPEPVKEGINEESEKGLEDFPKMEKILEDQQGDGKTYFFGRGFKETDGDKEE
jgi:GTPase SAR1 family protein